MEGDYCGSDVRFCDRVYDCMDRRDEDGCYYYSDFDWNDERNQTYVDDFGVSAVDALSWILFLISLCIPLTLLFYAAMKRIVEKCGIEFPSDKEDSLASEDDCIVPITPETRYRELERVLKFISMMDEALDENLTEESSLYPAFNDVHKSPLWCENIGAFFEVINVLCEKDERKIIRFCSLVRKLELGYHEGRVLNMDLCLKSHLKNRFSSLLFWNSEPPPIRRFYLAITPTCVYSVINSQSFKVLSIYIGLIKESLSHFTDFIRDWFVFFLLFGILSRYHDGSVPWKEVDGQILLFYGIIIFIPEFFITGVYFSREYRKLFGFEEGTKFKTWMKISITISCLFAAPFLPAFLLWRRFLLARNNVELQAKISEFLTKYSKDTDRNVAELEESLGLYKKNRGLRFGIRRVLRESKHLESSTETFFHFALQIILIISINFEKNFGSPVIEILGAFRGNLGILLYCSFVLYFFGLIATRVGIESHEKHGFFPDKAKIIYGVFATVSLITKITAIILYFAPSLGFFGLSIHYDRATNIPYNPELLPDPQPRKSITDYTLLTLTDYYIIFLVLIPIQLVLIWIIKSLTSKRFKNHKKGKVLHIFNCLTFPGIFKDWDDDGNEGPSRFSDDNRLEQIACYRSRYRGVKREYICIILFHALINVFLCLPTIYNSIQVIFKHESLTTPPLAEEVSAYQIAWCFIFISPAIFVIFQPLILYILIILYYKSGHPWARILSAIIN